MQPIYVTQSSTTPVFKTVNWWSTPQQISFAVISTGGSSYTIALCYEDPSFSFPSPAAVTAATSAITTFTLINATSNAQVVLPASMTPIAGFSFNLSTATAGSSVKVVCVALQSGAL
jgi:hypothetical protein